MIVSYPKVDDSGILPGSMSVFMRNGTAAVAPWLRTG